jgi:hypothetical protein
MFRKTNKEKIETKISCEEESDFDGKPEVVLNLTTEENSSACLSASSLLTI